MQRQKFVTIFIALTRLCINRINTHWFWRYHLRGVVRRLDQGEPLSLVLAWISLWGTSEGLLLQMVVICLHHILLMHHRIILLLEVITGEVVLKIFKYVVMSIIFTCLSLLLVSELILIHHHGLGALVLQLICECLGVEQLEPLHSLEAGEVFAFLDHLVGSLNLNVRVVFHLLLLVLINLSPIPFDDGRLL